MSAYRTQETIMTDQDCLTDALKEMKWRSGRSCEPEVHEEAQPLTGYQGDKRKQKANIIVRRGTVGGASNDIGFERVDGKFVAHISDYDRSYYGDKWLGELKQVYAKKHAMKIAKKHGLKFKGEKQLADGKTRLQFVKL